MSEKSEREKARTLRREAMAARQPEISLQLKAEKERMRLGLYSDRAILPVLIAVAVVAVVLWMV